MMTSRLILRAAGLLVPHPQRAGWLAEWNSELWYVRRKRVRFCLGAFQDALWLRRNSADQSGPRFVPFDSPVRCVLFLWIAAAVTAFWALYLPVVPGRTLGHVLGIVMAFVILPSTTSLALGEYPENASAAWPATLRWRAFLVVKFALIIAIVFCGLLDLAAISSTPLQAHGLLLGYVLGFRWALIDQRKRCPVCLRILTHPTRIGRPSQTFLEWYGTELMCARGHGILHVPEIPTISFRTQRWIYLDSSWSNLFVSQAGTNRR